MAFVPRGLNRMLDEHGLDLTLVKKGSGTYNPNTGGYTSSGTNYTVRGYFYDFSDDAVDGSNIQSGDSRLVLKSSQTDGVALPRPVGGDQITYGGDIWSVVRADSIRSGASVMCYLLHVRN